MRAKGFSLIEVLITFFLIMLMIVSIFSIFPQVRKGLAHSEARVNAAYVGRSLLEQQRALGFDNLSAATGTSTITGSNNGAPFTQAYGYTINVQSIDTDRKQLWATITWNDQSGTRQLTVETLVVKL